MYKKICIFRKNVIRKDYFPKKKLYSKKVTNFAKYYIFL